MRIFLFTMLLISSFMLLGQGDARAARAGDANLPDFGAGANTPTQGAPDSGGAFGAGNEAQQAQSEESRRAAYRAQGYSEEAIDYGIKNHDCPCHFGRSLAGCDKGGCVKDLGEKRLGGPGSPDEVIKAGDAKGVGAPVPDTAPKK